MNHQKQIEELDNKLSEYISDSFPGRKSLSVEEAFERALGLKEETKEKDEVLESIQIGSMKHER